MRAAILCLALSACTQFPELNGTEAPGAARAPYPTLVPLDGLLARAETGQLTDDSLTDSLLARSDALRARTQPRAAPGAPIGERAAQLRARAAALRGD